MEIRELQASMAQLYRERDDRRVCMLRWLTRK